MQPVNTDGEDVTDVEHQQQNVPQQQEAQGIGDMLNEEETLDQEEAQVQEEPVVEERMSAPPSPVPSDNSDTERHYHRPVLRESSHTTSWATQPVVVLGHKATSCTGTLQCPCPTEQCKRRVRG
ncbi:hypothetical protein NHX12_011388 [Muraenolepis orangiensis]|uniref:Uncharacterized protein n=1 Tax=Muraenolepis orangiensis TaxID=630683 RepID=A0A9Q0DJJ8_9TELE|nr:hypothetical protein NHX12_011388 [Muraenolepis orangiensis]